MCIRDRYLVVRFEDLATRPLDVLEQTCTFIGEDAEPAMLTMAGAPEHQRGNSSFGDLEKSKISTAPIGRFRTALTAEEIAYIQLAARGPMEKHGYDIDRVDLRGADYARFVIGPLPVTLTRMAAWSVRDRIVRSRQTVPAARLSPDTAPRPQRLAYVIGTYPLLTTTFIDREIRMLRSWGVELNVISIRRPQTELSPEQTALEADTTYVMPVNWRQVLIHNLRYAFGRPRRYFTTLFELATEPHPTWTSRIRTVGHFGLAAHVAGIISDRDLGHHLHAHFIDRAAVVALVAGRLLGLPYSVTAHANDIYVAPVLLRRKLADARFVATCTGYNEAHLASEAGAADVNITRVYHGLDLSAYPLVPRREHDPPTLVAVGQLKEKKGFLDLLDAAAGLRNRGYDFRCEIIGEGPLRSLLEHRIEALGLKDHVRLRGALPHDEVIAAYRTAAVFVLPCVVASDGDRDGIPNVILEASAMQLPVVSTHHSGIPEAVEHESTGLLVEPHAIAELTDALAKLLDEPATRADFGSAGRRLVAERFDVEANVKHLHEMFVP